jgi:hypothetical protein
MTQLKRIFLFDIDGVLVNPLAYRACVGRTVREFARLVGMQNHEELQVNATQINQFEASGVYCPWDMAAILCGEVLTKVSNQWADKDFEHSNLMEGVHKNNRSVHQSITTRLYQNLLLGESFAQVYQLESEYEGSSLLEELDEVLLAPEMAARVKSLWKNKEINISAYTGRPSYGIDPTVSGYSPEVEIALKMANFSQMPYVGLGSLEWLSQFTSKSVADLAKPNIVHAIAAILTALSPTTLEQNLREALELSSDKPEILARRLGTGLEVTVFEDTISGILPLRKIVDTIRTHGGDITLRAFGIATAEEKKRSLEPITDKVFKDVNSALKFALGHQIEG